MPHEEDGMEFSQENDEPEQDNNEPDHELLQLQKRKSTPKVIIQEFVQNFNSDDESEDDDDEIPDETKNPVKPEQAPVKKASIKEKEKTHYEIDNFGTLTKDNTKQCGLYEVSPLEKPSAEVIKRLSREYNIDETNNPDDEVSD
eukprot:CAMPEP_0170488310 /NCGR_PEP_ID=MMETSP0208-20121228/6895_1 /TAXON_ID=197538 /ORGANISM="Strombidium inclinatum, Strain S3" /LENGTH=143 /DNA_ID=CAMNT_0010762845 /DNA_START=61 /DNA_END=492 /DNA_ORIENTATION=-